MRDFVAFLRSRSEQAVPQEERIVKLGGLGEGYTFTEEESTAARREAWPGLGVGLPLLSRDRAIAAVDELEVVW